MNLNEKLREMRTRQANRESERRHPAATSKKPPQPKQKDLSHAGVQTFCYSSVEASEIHWLWRDRFALGKISILAGLPGHGKSLLATDIAARVTRGDAFPGCPEEASPAGNVLMLNAEDGAADTEKPRLLVAGADAGRVFGVSDVRRSKGGRSRMLELGPDLPRLEKKIKTLGNIRLLIIDPLTAYIGGGVDSHRDTSVRGVLSPLADLAMRNNIAVIAVMHLSKGRGQNVLSRLCGSIGFGAAARTVWAVGVNPHDTSRRILALAKSNITDHQPSLTFSIEATQTSGLVGVPRVIWEEDSADYTAEEIVKASERGRGRPGQLQTAIDWLKDKLANGPVPVKKIETAAAKNGVKPRTLQRAKETLGASSEKDKKGWRWTLPK